MITQWLRLDDHANDVKTYLYIYFFKLVIASQLAAIFGTRVHNTEDNVNAKKGTVTGLVINAYPDTTVTRASDA